MHLAEITDSMQLTVVKGNNGLPRVDQLLKFLVDNCADSEDVTQCANCDLECRTQDAIPMYFCNTCAQPLCTSCRDQTHQAKMFACHEIVPLAKRAKELHKKCVLHEEPYIMFSTEKKSMLCIKCFRDMQVESRAHCIDIETAYVQGCEKLDQAVLAVKELQTSTREAIILLKAMISEVRVNVTDEEAAISTLFCSMQERLADRRKILLRTAQSQHEEKEKAFKDQLTHMASLLPTLQVHLVTCSAFLSSASKYEFLDLGYQLMERLQKIVQLPHRLRPAQSSKINTEYRAEFARCLEALLFLSQRSAGVMPGVTGMPAVHPGNNMDPLSGCCPGSVGDASVSNSMARKPSSHRYISTKVLLTEGLESPFTEHCRSYENMFRTLQTELQNLKDQVQEMHRDLTKHHSLIKVDAMGQILQKSLEMDMQISSHYSNVQLLKAVFEEVWEETYQRVANEQEIYEAQLHDLLRLKQENMYLTTITRQIGPYIRSIAKVKERLEPRLKDPEEVKDERTDNMAKIYDDTSLLTGEGQHRNDLTCLNEEYKKPVDNQEKIIDNRTLNILPEESLSKNKEFYRSAKPKSGLESPGRKEITL